MKLRYNIKKLIKKITNESDLDSSYVLAKKNNELETLDTYNNSRQNLFDDDNYIISYVSDIHLISRIKVNKYKSLDDIKSMMNDIKIKYQMCNCDINLIAGDITYDHDLYELFISSLNDLNKKFFITLGNHELMNRNDTDINDIILEYKTMLKKHNMYLVHNNAYFFDSNNVRELSSCDLLSKSTEELRSITRKASLVIFGGIGYSMYSDDQFEKYGGTLSVLQEINECLHFNELYDVVTQTFYDKNVIILTHMPLNDWSNKLEQNGFIYVNGHTHKNYFFDDGKKRVYSDNQVGYTSKELFLKNISIKRNYDWFSDYKNGIYEISMSDYNWFYRGINIQISFNRNYNSITMIKKSNIYMFFVKNNKNELMILNGGSLKKAPVPDINYYYINLEKYYSFISIYLEKYFSIEKEISNEVKAFGGTGKIHGCIIDIDFYNHIYLNPLDGKKTPYYATSICDKYIYHNVESLLKFRCPNLFSNYKKIVETNEIEEYKHILKKEIDIIDGTVYDGSTSIYSISKIIKNLCLLSTCKVVRVWNDNTFKD